MNTQTTTTNAARDAEQDSRFVTTARCPDGVFFGAAWNSDGTLIAISEELPTRGKARSWARAVIEEVQNTK